MRKTEFYNAGNQFLNGLIESIESAELALPRNWDIDHLCFRTDSLESYQRHCEEISHFGKLLAESDVAGRPISTFKLNRPFECHGHVVNVLEVPAPKGSVSFSDGFEHVEIVVDMTLTEVKAMMTEAKISSSESLKPLNNELKISLPGGNIKFHHMSLETLIRLEQSPVFLALQSSNLLNTLAEFNPLLGGDYLLGLFTTDSELDVVLTMTDKTHLLEVLRSNFSAQTQFSVQEEMIEDEPAVICRFHFQEFPIKIFAQAMPSVQQAQIRHLQIEDRLLKLGGDTLLHKVQHRRARNLNTAEAFADALSLKGDPFESLLALQTLSSAEVSALTM